MAKKTSLSQKHTSNTLKLVAQKLIINTEINKIAEQGIIKGFVIRHFNFLSTICFLTL